MNALVVVSIEASRGSDGIRIGQESLGNMWATSNGRRNWPWLEFGLRLRESDGQFYGAAPPPPRWGTVGPELP
ncbi:MAG: hypothetical protein U0746_00740 [Gemmataceae bacterium]